MTPVHQTHNAVSTTRLLSDLYQVNAILVQLPVVAEIVIVIGVAHFVA